MPSFTVGRLRWPTRRLAALTLGSALVVAGAATAIVGGSRAETEPTPAPSLMDELPPSTWAFALPRSWLGAPVPALRPGDRLDFLAIRPGESASAAAIAYQLEIMSLDEHVIVLAGDAPSVVALNTARASGRVLIPLVRSTR